MTDDLLSAHSEVDEFVAEQHVAFLGLSVLQDYWGRGIGGALLDQCVRYGAENSLIEKLVLKVRADNQRAIHLYEKIGFHREGLLTREFKVDGVYYDHLRMGLFV